MAINTATNEVFIRGNTSVVKVGGGFKLYIKEQEQYQQQ